MKNDFNIVVTLSKHLFWDVDTLQLVENKKTNFSVTQPNTRYQNTGTSKISIISGNLFSQNFVYYRNQLIGI